MKKLFFLLCSTAILASCGGKKDEDKDKTGDDKMKDEKMADNKNATPPAMPDSATMAKNWQDYMTPGDMHKMLAKGNGNWAADVTMWEAPGAPATKSAGTAVNKMIMGGLYQESVHTSKMMGMPFSGKSTLGYDNLRKVFVSTWIDNMGSGIMYLEGVMDETGKTILFTGKTLDPSLGIMVNIRETMRIADENTQVMEMFTTAHGGTEMKTMEIKFTRVKG